MEFLMPARKSAIAPARRNGVWLWDELVTEAWLLAWGGREDACTAKTIARTIKHKTRIMNVAAHNVRASARVDDAPQPGHV